MIDYPLLSVVIPVYNCRDYILEALESVARQTYPNIEIIVIDNGSTDDTFFLVQDFCTHHSNTKLLRIAENTGGPARPRNVGIKAAEGEFIAFLDSDDVWFDNKISTQLAVMRRDGIKFSCTAAVCIDEKSRVVKPMASGNRLKVKRYGVETLVFKNVVMTSSVVVSTALLMRQQFEEDHKFITVEDYHLWMRLVTNGECALGFINQPLIKYRTSPKSLGRRGGRLKFLGRSLLACATYIVETENYKLLFLTTFSHLLRIMALMIKRAK